MKYYLTSLRKENYKVLENNNFQLIGFNSRSHLAEQLQVGDVIFIYIGSRVSKIVGMVEVKDICYWDTELIWDEVFPKRVRITPLIILKNHSQIDVREVLQNLSFVSNKERYGMSFFAGLRVLPDNDGIYLKKEIERRNFI